MFTSRFRYAFALLFLSFIFSANAQYENEDDSWFIGSGGGINISNLKFSNIDKEFYPKNNSNLSGTWNLFVEYDFGKNKMFGIRPQISLLTRGGRLSEIGKDYYLEYDLPEKNPEHLNDASYSLKATYFDIRVPFMFQPGNTGWKVRPYIYVAPIAGFVTKGKTKVELDYASGDFNGVKYPLTKANMNPFYFAGAFGIGAKWNINVGYSKIFIGLDLNYQLGFTDTYGSKEKKGDLKNVSSFFPNVTKVTGSRKINSFELTASIGIPFSVFSGPKKKTGNEPVFIPPVFEEVVIAKPSKPCYSLAEITQMISNGENVEGKTICAIEDNINFEFGKSDINPSSYPYLDMLADLFIHLNKKIRVSGHTDNVGSAETNMTLSRNRAKSVVNYLIKKGVKPNKISSAWYGYTRPVASNDTEEGRRLNRRVEFEILNN